MMGGGDSSWMFDEMREHKVRFEQATWDDRKKRPGKPV